MRKTHEEERFFRKVIKQDEAVSVLLLCRASTPGYGEEAGSRSCVAPFQAGRVSLPDVVRDAPLVSDLLPEDDRSMLEGLVSCMLRDVNESGAMIVPQLC